jgi:hypothetical protein
MEDLNWWAICLIVFVVTVFVIEYFEILKPSSPPEPKLDAEPDQSSHSENTLP